MRKFPQLDPLTWAGIVVALIVAYVLFRGVGSGQVSLRAGSGVEPAAAPAAGHDLTAGPAPTAGPSAADVERIAAAAARKAVAEELRKADTKKKDTRVECARLSPRTRRAAGCPETSR